MLAVEAKKLQIESLSEPVGIDAVAPRFSWILSSEQQGTYQSAYQILLRCDDEIIWDSEKVETAQTHHIRYAGKLLESMKRYTWQVKVWCEDGRESDWSDVASFVTGFMKLDDWQAKWISHPQIMQRQSPYLRSSFETENKDIVEAYIAFTAKGICDVYLDGSRITEDYLNPGWTDYSKRQHYRVYDITNTVHRGVNYIGTIIGEGWYKGQVGWEQGPIYGSRQHFLAQIHVRYADGSSQVIATDDSWECAYGAYTTASIMHGEMYDPRMEPKDWCQGGAAGQWMKVTAIDLDGDEGNHYTKAKYKLTDQLSAHPSYPIRVIKEFPVISVREGEHGNFIYDFGQNMAGVVRLRLNQHAGETIRMRHAEMITPEGTMYVENLRSAMATDFYTCTGEGEEIYQPRFTFHGFQYVEISGIKEPLPLDAVTACALSSDTKIVSEFSCSNAMLNQLQSNIYWTMASNFLDVPTDCPQRDERLGWTGDAQVFISTACGICDTESFWRKWLNDMKDSQREDGSIPFVIPNTPVEGKADAAWGDAITVCPTDLFQAYGDPEILAEWYPYMRKYVDYLKGAVREDNTRGGVHCFADWLALDVDDFKQVYGGTAPDLLQTAFYNWSLRLCANAAVAAGKENEAQELRERAEVARQAFDAVYFDEQGKSHVDTQTSYVIALWFELLPEEKRVFAAKRLVEKIQEKDNHLTTGFVGVSYLLPTLAKYGALDTAYTLLENKTFPSWGYSIENGATTVWERWNGWVKGVGPGDPNMNSYSHYAYGSVGRFMYSTVAGLSPLEPAYKTARIAPRPGGSLTQAKYAYSAINGDWLVDWQKDEDVFTCHFHIPANACAEVSLPLAADADVQVNGVVLSECSGITDIREEDGYLSFKAVSGNYECRAEATVLLA